MKRMIAIFLLSSIFVGCDYCVHDREKLRAQCFADYIAIHTSLNPDAEDDEIDEGPLFLLDCLVKVDKNDPPGIQAGNGKICRVSDSN